MNYRWISLLCFILLPHFAFGWTADEVDFPGNLQGWDLGLNSTKYTGPDGSSEWFRYAFTSGTTTNPYEFKMVTGNDWEQDYGGNTTFPKNEVDIMWYQPLGDTASQLAGGATNGFRYIFTTKDPGLANSFISVMELSGDPAEISFTTTDTAGSDSLKVNVIFQATPPPEQNVFLRYTTNSWTTWTIRQGTINANTGTVHLTGLAPKTVYEWYAFSSTATSNYLANADGFAVDALTLTWDNDNGNNYFFGTPGDAAWVWHNDNRVIFGGSNAQFWVKIGYANSDGSGKWVTNAAVYYTTDGSEPSGTNGVGGGTTQVRMMQFSHTESDASPLGDAMWWVGTVTNLNIFNEVKYKIGVWYDTATPERFADYNAAVDNQTFSFQIAQAGDPELTVNGMPANYTTSKFFVDEVAGDSHPVHIVFRPNAGDPITDIEVFSNLNRRDYATNTYLRDAQLVEEGIWPPDGQTINVGDDDRYYKAYAMDAVTPNLEYELTLPAEKTGAYRLTARYRTTASTNWVWYSSSGRRDHAITVSPIKARDLVMYEINTLNINATGPSFAQRSTFEDLHGGPGAVISNRVNLGYLQALGVNALWFQPIHPNHIDGRETDPNTGQPYDLGSPYAVKNFFEIMPQMSRGNTRPAAMTAFTNFVQAASEAGINIILDAAFNHTAWDAELAPLGVQLFKTNALATDEIRNHEARFYSQSGNYCSRASGAGNIAVAPDRGDFGKWNDVYDVFFGHYAALVCENPADNGNYNNEGDWFNYSSNWDEITRGVWYYFSEYIPYWLEKTGHPRGTPPEDSWKGIDGLRADFGQGLPPQAWEYIINKARSVKWDFVFMSESLDGGAPTYRSNRHFDILNENIVFALQGATSATAYRDIMEGRRNAYGQGLVLLNSVSHDEANYNDPWEALIRFAANSVVDGSPMIFYGQELGISGTWGFSEYELNFGKYIPHFKKYNSMDPIWNDADFGNDQLFPVYAGINRARHQSPALRSSNRYYLNQTGGGGPQQNIHSAGKYEYAAGSPATSDVVFAFANLDRWNGQSGNFDVNIDHNGQNLFGIKPERWYNVKNIAAYTNIDPDRDDRWLWVSGNDPEPRSGTNILDNGIFVSMNRVPQSGSEWTNAPYEAQYLKLFDVTPPPAPSAPSNITAKAYTLTNEVEFSWIASDFEGVEGYRLIIGTTEGGNDLFDGDVGNVLSYIISGLAYDQPVYAQVIPVSTAGITGTPSTVSSGVIPLDPAGDYDSDGMRNWAEDLAGTDPLSAASVFKVVSVLTATGQTNRWIEVATEPARLYTAFFSDHSLSNDMPWSAFANPANGIGTWLETNVVSATFTFVDDETADTTGGPPAEGRRVYRIQVEIP